MPKPLATPFPDDPSFSQYGSTFDALLFLDIDGVCHSLKKDGLSVCMERLPLLEKWLEENPRVGVVVVSSWRDFGKKSLSEDLEPIEGNLLGVCATEKEDPGIEKIEYNASLGGRSRVCRRWADAHGWTKAGTPAVALDDCDDMYPEGYDITLVRVDAENGMTEDVLKILSGVLDKRLHANKSRPSPV